MRYRCGAFFSRTLSVVCIAAWIGVFGTGASWAQGVKPGTPASAAAVSKPASTPQVANAPKPSTKAPVPAVAAASKPQPAKLTVLDERAQALKTEIQQLNQELQALEKAVLFPPSGQLAVLVSTGPLRAWVLESIELKLDGKVVAQHLYSPAEQAALQRGGVQSLQVSAVRMGEQELTVSITGQSLQGRAVKHSSPVKFEKGTEPKVVQLRIEDIGSVAQPAVAVRVGR